MSSVSAAPSGERFVDARQLAALMDVSVSTVKRWTAAGMPSYTWGLRVRRYRLSEAASWAADQTRMGEGRVGPVKAARVSQAKE